MLPCLGSDLAEQVSGQALHESSEVGPCLCTRSRPDEEGCELCQGIVREHGLLICSQAGVFLSEFIFPIIMKLPMMSLPFGSF